MLSLILSFFYALSLSLLLFSFYSLLSLPTCDALSPMSFSLNPFFSFWDSHFLLFRLFVNLTLSHFLLFMLSLSLLLFSFYSLLSLPTCDALSPMSFSLNSFFSFWDSHFLLFRLFVNLTLSHFLLFMLSLSLLLFSFYSLLSLPTCDALSPMFFSLNPFFSFWDSHFLLFRLLFLLASSYFHFLFYSLLALSPPLLLWPFHPFSFLALLSLLFTWFPSPLPFLFFLFLLIIS